MNNTKYIIQASNGMYFKRDMLSGEWVSKVNRASKLNSKDKAVSQQLELIMQYKVDCRIVEL